MNFTYLPNCIELQNASGKLIAQVTFPAVDAVTVEVNHTFVDDSLRGQGVAGQLMEAVAATLRLQSKKAILTCSYAKNWFEKRAEEYSDILTIRS